MGEIPTYQELEKRIIELEKAQSQRTEEIKSLKQSCFNPSPAFQTSNGPEFKDLFNLDDIQQLQDQFSNATRVASIITKTDGTPITRPSNFNPLFGHIPHNYRKNTDDDEPAAFPSAPPNICSHLISGLWNFGAAISVGGKHIADWLIGQVRDETQTEENFNKHAKKPGVDEVKICNAFFQIPAMSRKRFEQICKMLFLLAGQLSGSAYRNIQLRRHIAEQQKNEEALGKSKAYLHTLINAIPDLIWVKDPGGVYLFCNHRFEMFFNAKKKDIIGKTDYDFVDKETADIFRRNDKQAIARGAPSKNEEEVMLSPDGQKEIFETVKTPIYGDTSQLMGVLGIARNITGLKQAEYHRLANISFLENLDKVNQAIHGTNDLEQMMKNVLDIVLSIYKCDRSHLLYPCDPNVAFCEALMERTTAQYPGAFKLKYSIPISPSLKNLFQNALNQQSPVAFYLGREILPDEEPWKKFQIKSVLGMAIYPQIDHCWMFGIHACRQIRVWTEEEKRLFQEIGQRLTAGLNSLSMYRDLQKSEASYKVIWDTVPYPILIIRKADQKILQLNKSFTHDYNLSRQETIGSKLGDLNVIANPPDRERFYEVLSSKGRVDGMPIRFHTGDHNQREALVSMRPIRFQGQDCFILVNVDITEQRRIQRALEESEGRFRIIFESAADPIFLNDIKTGCFLDVNQAACRFLGYTKDEFAKIFIANIFAPDTFDPVTYFKQNELAQDSIFFESKQIRKDGSIAMVEVNSQRMKHQNQTILLSIVRDVTQRKQAEDELIRYRENLEKMVEKRTMELKRAQSELVKKEKLAVLGQLTATVSHELRNPLGVIRSSNFFLQRRSKKSDEKSEKHFKRIEEQVSICDTIVADLLEYTRGRKVSISKADLSPWLVQVAEQVQEQQEINITLDISPDLPAVAHDQEKMRRVIINLLTNAAQAVLAKKDKTEDFSPEIALSAYPNENQIVICISDNGIGMDQETKRRAFEPLFTTRARGTGIGLSIVKKVVEEHQGTMTIESKPGEGTRITLYLLFDFKKNIL